MKIVIVGTSNSVMGKKGFIKSLKTQHNVVQLSSGRTPFLCTLKTIMNNLEEIESADLLILDHYINDLNYYVDRLNDDYIVWLKTFYGYLSTVNVQIINILFPIENLHSNKYDLNFYNLIKKLSIDNNISLLDLNTVRFNDICFQDPIHLTEKASYCFGIYLNLKFSAFNDAILKALKGDRKNCPFRLVNANDIEPRQNVENFSNSLLSIDYICLNHQMVVESKKSERLLSIGYIKPKNKNGNSGLIFDNKCFVGFSGSGYFHEIVDLDIYGDFSIAPITGANDVKNLMDRGHSSGDFDYCYITEFLFFNQDITPCFISSTRQIIDFDFEILVDILDTMFNDITSLETLPVVQSKTINKLRDVAIRMEDFDLDISKDIMKLAHYYRPTGPFIIKKIQQYSK